MAGKYLSTDLLQNTGISSLYDRSLEVYGIKLVASGSVGGNISVPDEWIKKVAKTIQLLIDNNATVIDISAQEMLIKTLNGEQGTIHAGLPTVQRIGYSSGDSYSPNPLTDSGRLLWPGLESFTDTHANDDYVWYKVKGSPTPSEGDKDIVEVLEHLMHTIHQFGVRGAVQGSDSALDPESTSSSLFLAMKEAADNGIFDLSDYGGSYDNPDRFGLILKEYQYLLNFGMWEFSGFWDGGSLSPEWADSARTPEGVLAVNPLGYELFNSFYAPVLSKPDTSVLRNIFQDNDMGLAEYNPGQLIFGDAVADRLEGDEGDDKFVGLEGNDTINGGLGTDVVVFSGEVSTYTITEVGNTVVVSDSQSGRDGSDTLTSIENFQFSDGTFQLSELLNVTDIDRGIYRFFNVDTGTHFLSGSTVERDSVINNLDAFNFEGPTFRAADPTNVAADTVFRFFNTQTGTHFFTQSTVERDNILDTLPQFSFEGEAYKGYTEQVDGSIPLYRFFNTQTGTHFYTAAEAEKDSIIENLPTFNFEGTAYWVDPVMG